MHDKDVIEQAITALRPFAPSGFAIAFHIRFTTPDFLFQTYPKEWTDLYSERGMVMGDPIVAWGFENTGSIRWSELAHLDQVGVLSESRAFNMNYGVAIATDTNGSRSFAGFARPDREYTDEEIETLTKHVQTLHEATASTTGMESSLRDHLHELSVRMTHPSPGKSTG